MRGAFTIPACGICHKGGDPGKAPTPVAPVTETAAEVSFAKDQSRRDAAKRKGYLSTLLARDSAQSGTLSQSSLLGG